jgi:hypothetical protein
LLPPLNVDGLGTAPDVVYRVYGVAGAVVQVRGI